MFFKNPLEKKLRQWAKDVHASPPSAVAMKDKVLNLVRVPNKTVSRLRLSRLYFFALSCMAVVAVLFVGVHVYQKIYFFQATTPDFSYSAALRALIGSNDVAMFAEPDNASVAYETATGLGSSGSVLTHAVDTVKKVSREAVSLVVPTASVPDVREFLKYEYSARIKSRHVQELTDRLQTIVRGYGGRVDTVSVSEKFGRVYFVVPKSNLFAFQNEIKTLVKPRFFTESIQAQNLLPEKISIEKSAGIAQESLLSWQERLLALNKDHNGRILYMQKQLNGTVGNIAKLRNEVTTSSERQKEISVELSRLYAAQAKMQKNIAEENKEYNSQKFNLDNQIQNAQNQIENLNDQDRELHNTVEMVQGSVQLQWMSIFKMVNMYIPHLWFWIIVASIMSAIARYYSKRRTIELE